MRRLRRVGAAVRWVVVEKLCAPHLRPSGVAERLAGACPRPPTALTLATQLVHLDADPADRRGVAESAARCTAEERQEKAAAAAAAEAAEAAEAEAR